MRNFLILTLISVLVVERVTANDTLKCYQCNVVTQECDKSKMQGIICGKVGTSKCSRQVKKDAADKSKAIRKCVIPDNSGNVPCPAGYDCFVCDTELCNGDPIPTTTSTTTTSPNSSTISKVAWSSLVVVIFVAVYL
ncbi:hypothetical protein MTP99_017403 [Tenebrio molitor]|jgi:hypothetical protein|nr:hypothetical protein MTP99_017403 [Tenebrio molitor]CAH1376025.1 unnamed protein product [Tenebrio molitor]